MSAVIAGSLERIAAALEELVHRLKEKENLPPTPPIREKENVCANNPARARTYARGVSPVRAFPCRRSTGSSTS